MREIFFRGKRVDNGEWVEGFYVNVPEHYKHEMSGKSYIVSINNGLFMEIVPETVGQYTGLTDKNGKKIFEGDIVNYTGMPKIYMIDFHEEFLHCSLFYYDKELKNIYYCGIVHKNDGKSIEVIGNIHDNPEFLRGEE